MGMLKRGIKFTLTPPALVGSILALKISTGTNNKMNFEEYS